MRFIRTSALALTLSAALLAGAHQVLLNRFLPGGRGLQNADRLTLDREQLVEMLDVAESVAEAAKGVATGETAAIEKIRAALDAG